MSIDIAMQGTRVIGGIAPRLRGGAGDPPAPPVGILQTFTLENTNGLAPSPVKAKIGLPFKKGDVPTGSIPKLTVQGGAEVSTVQFTARVTWSDGSLKFAVLRMTDAAIVAAGSRTYEVEAVGGSYNDTPVNAVATVFANADINVLISNLRDATPDTLVGSGTFTASFQDIVDTRIIATETGPECTGIYGWIMAKDQTGGAEDPDLKIYFDVDYWKDGTYSYRAIPAQDWWESSTKDRRTYDLTLRDGATAIESYNNISHPYHQRWTTAWMADDAQHGQRHWSANMPTLFYKYDRVYLRDTKLIPHLDLNFTPISKYTTGGDDVYVPLSNIAHSAAIDSGGAYTGRGMIANSDAIAFMRQTPEDERARRVNGLVGLHLYAHRTNDLRTRPGESADIASTPISLPLDPKLPSEYDFTSEGMPSPKHAHRGQATNVGYEGGWQGYDGGDGVWILSINTSHAANYSYFSYLIDGERCLLEALIDHGVDACHRINGNYLGSNPPLQYGTIYTPDRVSELGIPSTRWESIAALLSGTNSRGIGLSQVVTGAAAALVPDDDVVANYLKLFNKHQSDYLNTSKDYYAQGQRDLGLLVHHADIPSNWMQDIQVMGACFNDAITESGSFNYAKVAEPRLNYIWGTNRRGFSGAYRIAATEKSGKWHPTNNPYLDKLYHGMLQGSVTSSSADISLTLPDFKQPTVGDICYVSNVNQSATPVAVPSDLSLHTKYYVVSLGLGTFQISVTPGGPAITFSQTMDVYLNMDLQADDMTFANENGYVPPVDDPEGMSLAATVMLYKGGSSVVTEEICNNAVEYCSTLGFQDEWVNWRLVP